jgi:hypothetical protein
VKETPLGKRGDHAEIDEIRISSDGFWFVSHHQVLQVAHYFRKMAVARQQVTS